ncbi:acyltransferase [Curtobacterium sp. Csp1]|uniref:acyltransferase family protein n=1 Tax=unclassified Curtobacterium TaxID=257496 RepID=UPI000E09F8A8|nr:MULTISPECIES: acyltransferase [unclassified Curtobacterium]QKS12453.1 acyltransferase [Curtobacterium sp. csp3]QKS20037.1 acyltransferase [Curtobacterium sp. Csp1]RDH98498.1 fucose 4-O-acetylase-like acetyltransferase [Curtobacterium sp. AG1037]
MGATAGTLVRQAIAQRDLVVDLVRTTCVVLVVVVHITMVGVAVGPDGIAVTSPLQEAPWYVAATWVGQVMPLFFVVGGFASAVGWRSTVARGGGARDFVATRLVRLFRPAIPLFLVLAVALGTATALGTPPELLGEVAFGIGSPLWFLAAYGITQCCVPLMARLHARAPWRTLGALLVLAAAVDAVRFATGVAEVGLLNLGPVWLFAQQLGFLWADGWFARRSRLVLVGGAVAGYAALVPLTSVGLWAPDMLQDLNPPMLPLAFLAVAQACLVQLAHGPLSRLMRTRGAQAAVFVVGRDGMVVYLWHLPLFIALNGIALLLGAPFPEPGSTVWWATRPVALVVVLAVAIGIARGLRWFDRPLPRLEPGTDRPGWPVLAVAALCTIGPAFAVMQLHLSLGTAVVGAVLVPLGVVLLGRTVRLN